MIPLGISLLDSPDGAGLLADLAPRARNVRFSTGEHGFDTFSCFYPCSLIDSWRLYDRPGLPWVAVSGQGGVVWEGRLEDVAIVPGGVRLTAFGGWRAYTDVPYTALWSTTSLAGWFPLTTDNFANTLPDAYQIDTLNRLYVALTKNTVYGNNVDAAILLHTVPNQGSRNLQRWELTYSVLLPTNWQCQFYKGTWDHSAQTFGSAASLGSAITGDGTLQTGSLAFTSINANCVIVDVFNSSGGNYTMSGETGDFYVKITGLRLLTGAGSTVYASEIAAALAAYVNSVNPSQAETSSLLLKSPGVDLQDEEYADQYPADILDALVDRGDDSNRQYEVGVWADRVLALQPRGTTARQWYVDVSALEVEHTLDTLRNSAYGLYQDANGRTLRTGTTTGGTSVNRYGLTRRAAVDNLTTSSTQAIKARDAYFYEHRYTQPRAGLMFRALYDATGTRWPLWAARAWDTLTIRNLPPTLSSDIDRLRTFRLSATEYDADNDVLEVVPETPLPSLPQLVARAGSASRDGRTGERR